MLADMTRGVFQAGFSWKVIDAKWAGFEEAFHGFDVPRAAFLEEREISDLATDTRIVRYRAKIASVRDNARFIMEIREEAGSFGKFLAKWPEDDLVGLWSVLKKRGSRLGGMTGQYFLRTAGKDVFMLTRDVAKCLIEAGVVDKNPTSKGDLAKVQAAFNAWKEETGRPFCELSRIAAYSIG